jgi:hypothetical protein
LLLTRRGWTDNAEKIFQTKLDVAAYLVAHIPRGSGQLSPNVATSDRSRAGQRLASRWPAKVEERIEAAIASQAVWLPTPRPADDTLPVLSSATPCPLYSDDERDEALFAVDSLQVDYLHDLIRANPNVVHVTDASGTSLISLACSLIDDTGAATLERVLTVVSLLLDSGCGLASRNRHNWTAVDVLKSVQGGKHFAMAAAAIVAQLEERRVCDRVIASTSACRACSAENLHPATGVDGARCFGAWSGLWM